MDFQSLVYNTIYQRSLQQSESFKKVLRNMVNCGFKKRRDYILPELNPVILPVSTIQSLTLFIYICICGLNWQAIKLEFSKVLANNTVTEKDDRYDKQMSRLCVYYVCLRNSR